MNIPRFGGRHGKRMRQLLHRFEDWQADKTNGGHIRLRGPQGQLIYTAATSNNWHTIWNLTAQMKRSVTR